MNDGVGIVLCECSGEISGKIDFKELKGYSSSLEGVRFVVTVDRLCGKPFELRNIVESENLAGLIVAGCTDPKHTADFRDVLTDASIHPFACEFINLKEECAEVYGDKEIKTERAKLLVKAYVEKVRNLGVAERVKPFFSLPKGPVSRRRFLRLPLFLLSGTGEYLETPTVNCKQQNCKLCVDACPFNALTFKSEKLSLLVNECMKCGFCATVCPYGYIQMPTFSDEQAFALLDTLADPTFKVEGRTLVFTCDTGRMKVDEAIRDGWKPQPDFLFIRVPCVASLTHTALIRGLELGFDALLLLCANSRCEKKIVIHEAKRTVDSVNKLSCVINVKPRIRLIEMGDDKEVSKLIEEAKSEITDNYGRNRLNTNPTKLINERRKDFVNILKNNQSGKPSYTVLRGLNLPFFDVKINENKCDMCMACINVCPTNALVIGKDGGSASIKFNHSNCIGCNLCVEKCPSKAVKMERALDVSKLIQGKLEEKKRDPYIGCKVCGRPIGLKSQINYAAEKLKERGSNKLAELLYYCDACKTKAFKKIKA